MTRNRTPATATRGLLIATAPTVREAKAKLESLTDAALNRGGPFIESRFGRIIIIAADPNGWTSTHINPADLAHGRQAWPSLWNAEKPLAEIIQSQRIAAAQAAWTHATNDEEHIALADLDKGHAESLRRWTAFQRRYAVEKAGGATDAEAWNRAMGEARSFEPAK